MQDGAFDTLRFFLLLGMAPHFRSCGVSPMPTIFRLRAIRTSVGGSDISHLADLQFWTGVLLCSRKRIYRVSMTTYIYISPAKVS